MAPVNVRSVAMAVSLGLFLGPASALAGPPYVTDDPETVEHRHWELYLASQSFHDREGWRGTAPHFEVNYGLFPDVQLHVIAPLAYDAPDRGGSAYGYGDTELGTKVRFVHEGAVVPQIGTFPLLEAPTATSRSLGNGTAQLFLPLWVQKSFGPWTTYGGAGFWIDLGRSERHFWYFGWQGQRRLDEWLTIGAEAFLLTPEEPGGEIDARFNLGAVIDLGDVHHILLSAGRGFAGPNLFQYYVAYLVTLGPDD